MNDNHEYSTAHIRSKQYKASQDAEVTESITTPSIETGLPVHTSSTPILHSTHQPNLHFTHFSLYTPHLSHPTLYTPTLYTHYTLYAHSVRHPHPTPLFRSLISPFTARLSPLEHMKTVFIPGALLAFTVSTAHIIDVLGTS